jgi:hypothetical protein
MDVKGEGGAFFKTKFCYKKTGAQEFIFSAKEHDLRGIG